jgi:hypothetical protein
MMSNSGQVIDLGQAGLNYLQGKLASSGALGQLLLRLSLERGRVLTQAPTPSNLPEDFDEGLDPNVAKLQWEYVIDLLIGFLRQSDGRIVLFEHPFATPDAQWLAIKPVPHLACGNEVLFAINSSWAEHDKVELALVTAGAQNELGIMTRHPTLWMGTHASISHATLEEAVASTDGIILRAFDAEGYLVWLPDRDPLS